MANFPDFTPYLESMMAYWGPMMDVATERAQALPEREAIAFDQYLRGKRKEDQLSEEEILELQDLRKMRRKAMSADVLSAAPRDPYLDAMTQARAAADARSYGRGRDYSDMMRTKTGLERIPRIPTGGITGTESWRNLPAAAAMTGINLPRSGFDVYADIAAGGSRQSGVAEGEAGAMRRQKAAGSRSLM